MTTLADDDDTIEAQAPGTSLDPYGQLVRMLMPRAQCIAIYDRAGGLQWLSDGCDSSNLLQFAEESLHRAYTGAAAGSEREGAVHCGSGETSYLFVLRDGASRLGALALSCEDGAGGSRPFSYAHSLLRPVLQALGREMANQYALVELRRDLASRETDLSLLLGSADGEPSDDIEPGRLLRHCVDVLGCVAGALLIPNQHIELAYWLHADAQHRNSEALEQMQHRVLAWIQVQRRTLMLNKSPSNSPMGALPYKLLACPIRRAVQLVEGVLILFRPLQAADFSLQQARCAEWLARRIAATVRSSYDVTTGLLTRQEFERRACETLARADASSHCLAHGDIDRLHHINENHGMHVGDEVIARAAEAIRLNLPAGAFAAHFAGGRFALFFERTPLEVARRSLDALRSAVAGCAFEREGATIELSLTFGLAETTDRQLPLSHAFASAEAACKASKAAGESRAGSTAAPRAARVDADDDAAILATLREAIANDCFRMHAQPILQIGCSGAHRRFELLLRMFDESGVSIAPEKFFAAAARRQFATRIDRWVVRYALEVLSPAAAALENLGAHFAVNISAQSLADDEFFEFLTTTLREYALPPNVLSFEIAETAVVANIVRAEALIHRLSDLGHAIALDDFGRGLSSLTYLKDLPASHLKIDGALVRELAAENRSHAALAAIVESAQRLSLQTTAKCVESDALLTAVARLGVSYAQGFAVGRPQPLEQVLRELLRGAPGVVRRSGSPLIARLSREGA